MRKSLLILLGALLLLTPASAKVVLEEHFEGEDFPPDNWYTPYKEWKRNDSTELDNYAGTGYCAAIDPGEGSVADYLKTRSIDLRGYISAKIEFKTYYNHGNDLAQIWVGVGTDGKNWTLLEQWNTNKTGTVEFDLTPYVGNETVYVAWLYNGSRGWWEIDDVKVTARTAAIPEFPGFALVLAVLASILGVLLRR